jgi:probable rRNA maturation factor
MAIRFASQGVHPPNLEYAARRGVAEVFRHEKARLRRDLNIIWTTRKEIRRLNRRFRGKNRFTDVIAFRYDGFETRGAGSRDSALPFGDLFIAVPQARLNARRFGVPLSEELLRLVVHGTLHLFDYTDYEPREKKKMWAVQEKIVKKIAAGI